MQLNEVSGCFFIMPAKHVPDSDQGAGIQLEWLKLFWIPAFAGMTAYFAETPRHPN